MKLTSFFIGFILFSLTSFAIPNHPMELEKQLQGDGLKGWIHGASEPLGLYVFTYREPGNFFAHQEFPLVAGNPEVERALQTLKRHDEVTLKGRFLANQASITHIWVSRIEVVQPYESPNPAPEAYSYQAKLPEELLSQKEISAKVHAVVNEGRVLVIEYKDAIVPVVVEKPDLVKGLFRNDKVRLKIEARGFPPKPTHISLDLKSENPLVVTDRMVDWHGKKGSVEGQLVLFPQSPQIRFNVFAVQVPDEQGVTREFTLVNFEDSGVFMAIREKLQNLWDSESSGIEDGRNKLIHKNIRIKATGSFNVVHSSQANPQVLLAGPDSIEQIKN